MNPRISLALATACALLAASLPAAAQGMLNTGFMPDPRNYSGMSGGPVQASSVDPSCRGAIPVAPHVTFFSRTGFRFLRLYAVSSGDLTLMVRTPDGLIRCADDTYGLNPGVDVQGSPPGRYEVWVGSYNAGAQFPFSLSVTELPSNTPETAGGGGGGGGGYGGGGGVVVQSVLRHELPARFGRIAFNGIRNATARGRTGGDLDASQVRGQGTCRGWVAAEPSYVMNVQRGASFARLFVQSAADTTLIVQYPDGSIRCSDDSFSTLHPSIDGEFPPGTYYVWVGIYRSGMTRPFRLTVTSDPSLHP